MLLCLSLNKPESPWEKRPGSASFSKAARTCMNIQHRLLSPLLHTHLHIAQIAHNSFYSFFFIMMGTIFTPLSKWLQFQLRTHKMMVISHMQNHVLCASQSKLTWSNPVPIICWLSTDHQSIEIELKNPLTLFITSFLGRSKSLNTPFWTHWRPMKFTIILYFNAQLFAIHLRGHLLLCLRRIVQASIRMIHLFIGH